MFETRVPKDYTELYQFYDPMVRHTCRKMRFFDDEDEIAAIFWERAFRVKILDRYDPGFDPFGTFFATYVARSIRGIREVLYSRASARNEVQPYDAEFDTRQHYDADRLDALEQLKEFRAYLATLPEGTRGGLVSLFDDMVWSFFTDYDWRSPIVVRMIGPRRGRSQASIETDVRTLREIARRWRDDRQRRLDDDGPQQRHSLLPV